MIVFSGTSYCDLLTYNWGENNDNYNIIQGVISFLYMVLEQIQLFGFYSNNGKDQFPPGYLLKERFIKKRKGKRGTIKGLQVVLKKKRS